MFYVQEIITDANTPASTPKETRLKVWAGVIHRCEVMFPPGPAGLLHVTISHGGHQIYPSNELQNFASDSETVGFNDYYQLQPGLNLMIIRTWNVDETFAHTCRVRLGVMPSWIVSPYMQFTGINSSLRRLLARIGATE